MYSNNKIPVTANAQVCHHHRHTTTTTALRPWAFSTTGLRSHPGPGQDQTQYVTSYVGQVSKRTEAAVENKTNLYRAEFSQLRSRRPNIDYNVVHITGVEGFSVRGFLDGVQTARKRDARFRHVVVVAESVYRMPHAINSTPDRQTTQPVRTATERFRFVRQGVGRGGGWRRKLGADTGHTRPRYRYIRYRYNK